MQWVCLMHEQEKHPHEAVQGIRENPVSCREPRTSPRPAWETLRLSQSDLTGRSSLSIERPVVSVVSHTKAALLPGRTAAATKHPTKPR